MRYNLGTLEHHKTYAGKIKMTYYINKDLAKKFYNFAYWYRLSITEAINKLIEDGLKGKTTKDTGRIAHSNNGKKLER